MKQCRRSVNNFRTNSFLRLLGTLRVLNAPHPNPSPSPASMSKFPSRGNKYGKKCFQNDFYEKLKNCNKTITSCSIRRVSASLTVYVLHLVSASLTLSKALVECVLALAVALQPFAKSFAKQETLCDGEHLRRSAKGFAKAFANGVAKGCMCERFCEKACGICERICQIYMYLHMYRQTVDALGA